MFLARFRTSPDMQRFRMILDKELSSCDAKSRNLDGPALYRLQGVGAWLVDLFQTIDKASGTLANLPVGRLHQPLRTVSLPAESSGGIRDSA
jgi:hypothetical protein